MSHESNLDTIRAYLTDTYTREETRVVPKRSDLTFRNTIKQIPHAVVFYIDMRGSRKMWRQNTSFQSIKVHRAFLQGVVYCVEKRDGHFRSFNGDGALAFFVGENAASRAVRAALDVKAYVREINHILSAEGLNGELDFGIGIAQGEVDVAKSGKRGDDATKQDLVWIGTPVYLAVELSNVGRKRKNIWISSKVRGAIEKQDHLGVVRSRGESMWTKTTQKLGDLGTREVRYTTFFSSIF
jgi:class 3 adenylate cyclase